VPYFLCVFFSPHTTRFAQPHTHIELMVVDPEDMAPLDENGIPKYKGKKRGRKPKKRKRMKDPDRPKRQHTAYTLFVQETYPTIRQNNPELPSKDVISIVARQWAEVNELEKKAWKARALSSGAGTTNAVEDESSKAVGGASTALVETHDKEAKEAAAVAAAAATAAGDVVVHGLEVEESEDDEEEEEEDDEEEEEQDETTLTTTAEETTRRKRRVTRNKAR